MPISYYTSVRQRSPFRPKIWAYFIKAAYRRNHFERELCFRKNVRNYQFKKKKWSLFSGIPYPKSGSALLGYLEFFECQTYMVHFQYFFEIYHIFGFIRNSPKPHCGETLRCGYKLTKKKIRIQMFYFFTWILGDFQGTFSIIVLNHFLMLNNYLVRVSAKIIPRKITKSLHCCYNCKPLLSGI